MATLWASIPKLLGILEPPQHPEMPLDSWNQWKQLHLGDHKVQLHWEFGVAPCVPVTSVTEQSHPNEGPWNLSFPSQMSADSHNKVIPARGEVIMLQLCHCKEFLCAGVPRAAFYFILFIYLVAAFLLMNDLGRLFNNFPLQRCFNKKIQKWKK